MDAVVMNHLSKKYSGGKTAVEDMSLTLKQGEIFGFLGPNGAGKTTTVKVLNGMLQPSEGDCLVFGESPSKNPEKVHAVSGVMTEHAQMYNNLTGLQNLIFYGAVFGIGEAESRKRAQAGALGCSGTEVVCVLHGYASASFDCPGADAPAENIVFG